MMFIWLTGTKIILYSWFIIRLWQKTPLSFPLITVVVAVLAGGLWRTWHRYSHTKGNLITLLLDLFLAVLLSFFPKSAGFDKLFMIYLIEGTALLPKPFFFIYAILATICAAGSYTLFEFRATGQMQLLGIAEILLYGFAFILVLSERRQREQKLALAKLSKELHYVNLQLNESMVLSEKLAIEAERRQMAAEIHDSLGHDLTGLILTLEAGKRLMNHDPEAAKTFWDKALGVSRAALDSVRELVSEKREGYFQFELNSHLKKMASEVQVLTGLQINIDMEPEDLHLSNQENLCLYRIFQEAVTNTLRHGGAGRAQISISVNPEAVVFSYGDNGTGTNKIEAGNGLKGMMERIAALDGDISFHSQVGGGFQIYGQIDKRRGINEEA